MDKMIACCGLNCAECDARKATVANDDVLRERTAKLWAEMNNAPEITADTINCMGCRQDGVKFYYCSHLCPIKKCVHERGFEHCGYCPELETCEKILAIHCHNAEAKNNLKNSV